MILHPMSKIKKPTSGIQDPGPEIQDLYSWMQNLCPRAAILATEIYDPGSWIHDLASGSRGRRPPHPACQIQDPNYTDPGFRIQDPGCGIPNSQSWAYDKVQYPDRNDRICFNRMQLCPTLFIDDTSPVWAGRRLFQLHFAMRNCAGCMLLFSTGCAWLS
jgi:hypothetical protein